MRKIVSNLPSLKVLALSVGLISTSGIALTPSPAHAWGFVGHEYIGHSSYAYLTDQARNWVDNQLEYLGEDSLATSTTWADRVRGTDAGAGLGPLHFANIPPHATQFDMQRDCPQRRCVVGAAFDALDVLFDPNQDTGAQADALRKLTHWITDLHQPLHLGFAEDRGGNDIVVLYNDEPHNLHRVWDTLIVIEKDLPAPNEFAANNPLPATADDWYQAIENWATEANQLAREYAYNGIEDGQTLSDEYIQNARQVIRVQLLRSAQRMAQLINHAAEINQ